MSARQLQDYVFTSKYSRYVPEQGRRETWDEATERVMGMHLEYFRRRGKDVSKWVDEVKPMVLQKRVLGSQRALQFGGDPVLKANARIYNCTTSYCDRPRFFQEALWLLLCGCGVGFSVQKHHIARLPHIARPTDGEMEYTVADSIEGWADALGTLLSGYFTSGHPNPEYAGKTVRFNFDQIRPKGAPLGSNMGKAPGPDPLNRSLDMIRALLDRCVDEGQDRLRPIDAYDILMHASDAVLSGGVRRSATLCLFSPDDQEMVEAKTGNWFHENPQRARSNNSALLLRDSTPEELFKGLIDSVRQYGEPGFIWADDTETTYNPCGEIGLYPQIDGESGWAFCNLCEINVKAIEDREDFAASARAAAILGTLQAAYTDFKYLGEVSTRIAEREALLGVSMTGMMERPDLAFDPELQKEMAELILEVNAEVAADLGINTAARATCVKPAGTTSCILGTSSGIHPHHAKRYLRRAQANADEAIVDYFRDHNPRAVERSVWNPNGTDVVLTFCVEAREGAKVKGETSAVELLEHVRLTQAHWIAAGRRPERCAQPWLSHNVSNTITVREDEWEDCAQFIWENRNWFAGVSLLPEGGDLDYPQAPFCEVLSAGEIVERYGVGAIMSSGLIVDGLRAFDNDLWAACDAALGRGADLDADLDMAVPMRVREVMAQLAYERKDWVRRAEKFARNYFDGDVLNMTRCLKRVHNCKMWEDLQREYKHVDYTGLREGEDNTELLQAAACAGGACEVI